MQVLAKGAAHAEARGSSPDELLTLRLTDDMAPLTFQIVSVWYHSLGAMRSLESGLFQPPPKWIAKAGPATTRSSMRRSKKSVRKLPMRLTH
ncbi:DUF1993 family protein [Halioglobus japonicus]|uniref:DUF1993 family protein n=1 Tax=Halioglobus japonicus TaxID=930805 RepID=UPI000A06A01A